MYVYISKFNKYDHNSTRNCQNFELIFLLLSNKVPYPAKYYYTNRMPLQCIHLLLSRFMFAPNSWNTRYIFNSVELMKKVIWNVLNERMSPTFSYRQSVRRIILYEIFVIVFRFERLEVLLTNCLLEDEC